MGAHFGCPFTCDHKPKVSYVDEGDPEMRINALRRVCAYSRLNSKTLNIFADGMSLIEFRPGDLIVQQGDLGEDLYTIKKGNADVLVDDGKEQTKVATLTEGDYFGELGFVGSSPRTATIQAATDMQCFVLKKGYVQELHLSPQDLNIAPRDGVGVGMRTSRTKKQEPSKKTPADTEFIIAALKRNKALESAMTRVGDPGIADLASCMWITEVESGFTLISEGDPIADYFYIVQEGIFNITVKAKPKDQEAWDNDSTNSSKLVATLKPGDSLGELALFYSAPRAATATAAVNSKVWVVDRDNFFRVLMKDNEEEQKEYIKILEEIDIELLDKLSEENKKTLAQALQEMSFVQGQHIITQGEPGTTFYILTEGTVDIVKDDKLVKQLFAEKAKEHKAANGRKQSRKPPHFGERALVTNEPRAATVKVTSATAKVLSLSKLVFDELLNNKPMFLQYKKPRMVIPEKDLVKKAVLGCGGFGCVDLVQRVGTNEMYAKKVISKGYIVKQKAQDIIISEKRILMMCDSPFIVKLYCTYNSPQTLSLLLEAILGGELFMTYELQNLFESESHARFYVSSVCCAFEHFHERYIIYRDLKPENILLDTDGKVKITDMGFAKYSLTKTFTTCGTPEYFAPEMITRRGHSFAVDWWAVGILAFELMVGYAPFCAKTTSEMYKKIMDGWKELKLPPKLRSNKNCNTFIGDLLKPEPSERIAMLPGGMANVEAAPWFNKFSWKKLREGTMTAPYKPSASAIERRENFNKVDRGAPELDYLDDGTGWDRDF